MPTFLAQEGILKPRRALDIQSEAGRLRGRRLIRESEAGKLALGVETRTSDWPLTRWRGRSGRGELRSSRAFALGGATTLAIWPGAARHVQSESLKAVDLSHWQVSTPRLPSGAPVQEA
jgi:hypothetical protein